MRLHQDTTQQNGRTMCQGMSSILVVDLGVYPANRGGIVAERVASGITMIVIVQKVCVVEPFGVPYLIGMSAVAIVTTKIVQCAFLGYVMIVMVLIGTPISGL